jgi:hypothetical protein
MQNHYERHAAIGRHDLKKAVERVNPSRGGADTDNRKYGAAHVAVRNAIAAAI